MRRPTRWISLAAAGMVAGCLTSPPDSVVEERRSQYAVFLENITIEPPTARGLTAPIAVAERAAAAAEVAATAYEAALAEADGAEAEREADEGGMDAGPRPVSVLFDLLVRFGGDAPLSGVTVDFVHRDLRGDEKARTFEFIDTGGLPDGGASGASIELDFNDYEDGDVFEVELRSTVPPEDRSLYREFAEGGE